jgi:hypothetical protein
MLNLKSDETITPEEAEAVAAIEAEAVETTPAVEETKEEVAA